MTLNELRLLLPSCWCADTSADPAHWSPTNPSWGQCAVTALIVQDLFGGDLLRCSVSPGGSHYLNRTESGQEIDLTRSQFKSGQFALGPCAVRSREYVVSFTGTRIRYCRLRDRLLQAVAAGS